MTAQKKTKARLLLAVWGEKYFDYLTRFALPSWLTENNLPALAALAELEIDILTRRSDGAAFSASASCATLRAICPVNFVDIDDLIGKDMYSVTLTGAFGRGITRHGAAMTDTAFIFMNADFILSDGSLKHLGQLIARGETAIMAPSYRAVEEAVAPVLTQWIGAHGGQLDMPPRRLVDLALRHPHPTTVAKFVTQQGVTSRRPNQLYWRVDDTTVIGHYLLTFMLCIKPARVVHHVNSYCDYSFIQHFASLDALHTIRDSDDLFMLELQSHDFERELLRPGANTPAHVAQASAAWATALHHANLKETLLFHSADLPPDVDAAKSAAQAFAGKTLALLPAPQNHIGHPHWIGGLTNWRVRSGVTRIPEEFAHADNRDGLTPPTTTGARLIAAARRFNQALSDDMPVTPFWHFHWSNHHRFAREIDAIGRTAPFIFISEARHVTPGLKRLARHGLVTMTPDGLADDSTAPRMDGPRHAVLLLHPDRLADMKNLVGRMRALMPQLREIVIFSPLYLGAMPQASVPTSSIMRQIDMIIPTLAGRVETVFSGGPLQNTAHETAIDLTVLAEARPHMALFAAMLLGPVVLALGTIGNCMSLIRQRRNCNPKHSSGLFIKINLESRPVQAR